MRKLFQQLNQVVEYYLEELFSFISTPACYGCGRFLDNPHVPICQDCAKQIHFAGTGPVCLTCRSPIESSCHCEENYQAVIPKLYFWGNYTDLVRELVHQFKFGGHKHLGGYLVAEALDYFKQSVSELDCDIIIPVPMTVHDRAQRGFNQSALMAEQLSHASGIPIESSLLKKIRKTALQANLGREDRWRNISGAFGVAGGRAVEGKWILIFDDIVTTGATCLEASKVLLAAGAKRVTVIALFSSHRIGEESWPDSNYGVDL
jgi:competence protein ComFC